MTTRRDFNLAGAAALAAPGAFAQGYPAKPLRRSPLVPDIPTMDEAGLKGFLSNTHFGVYAPAGTSAAITARLNSEINNALASADFRDRLASFGAEPVGGTPAQFAAVVARETDKYAAVIKRAGVKAE